MKLLKTSLGFIFSFGFDMRARKPDPNIVCWNAPESGEWESTSTNLAGAFQIHGIAPEFVRESNGRIVAYQPGRCVEITYLGSPLVFGFRDIAAEVAP